MITTSATYKTAVDADTRRFVPKVLIYFDGDAQMPVTFYNDRIIDLSLLEEAQADSSSPLGAVSSNELSLSFDNFDRAFTPTNSASPYYGKLLPNKLVEPFVGLEIEVLVGEEYVTQYEWIPLGKYRTGDWSAPAISIEATTTCHDTLYDLGDKEVPDLPVLQNTTLTNMFVTLFTSIGLTGSDYVIDPALNSMIIKYGWFEQGKVLQMLQKLAESGGCTVFANRSGKIEVVSNLTSTAPVRVLNDANQIIGAEAPQAYLSTYSRVDIIYTTASVDEDDTVINMADVVIPAGGITLEKLAFSSAPIFSAKYVALVGAASSQISEIAYGANFMKLVISNSGAEEIVDIVAIGKPLVLVENTVTVKDDALIALIKEKTLSLNTPLVQNATYATSYATQVLQLVSDPVAYVDVEFRGDPSLELLDTVTIDDASDKITATDVIPYRYDFDFTGGALVMRMSTIKRSTRL